MRRAGLAAVSALLGCAVMEEPPGGPPDFTAPAILAVTPDSGTEAPGLRDPLVFRFDEVISEQSGGGLARLIEVSPRPEAVNVRWRRTAVSVRPDGGWRDSVTYRVTLLPGVTDLRNNRLTTGRSVVFSTGGPIPNTRIDGTVLDWEGGRVGLGAIIEARRLVDSLVYVGTADSNATFSLAALPAGAYHVVAAMDGNSNRRIEPREPFDSTTVTLDSTLSLTLWAFARDTVGPTLQPPAVADSLTARLEFSQTLAPGPPDSTSVSAWLLPDTTPVAIAAVWDQPTWDSVRAAGRAARDTAAGDTAAVAPDTAMARRDTVAAPPPPRRPGQAPPRAGEPGDTTQTARDSTVAERLLATRPALESSWYVRFVEPLRAGARYLLSARARSPAGREAESRSVLVTPEPRDST